MPIRVPVEMTVRAELGYIGYRHRELQCAARFSQVPPLKEGCMLGAHPVSGTHHFEGAHSTFQGARRAL